MGILAVVQEIAPCVYEILQSVRADMRVPARLCAAAAILEAAGEAEFPAEVRAISQPVRVPGDMGRAAGRGEGVRHS